MRVMFIDGVGRERVVDVREGVDEIRIPLGTHCRVVGDLADIDVRPPVFPIARFRATGEQALSATEHGLALLPVFRMVTS